MGLKCTILGHSYEPAGVEREREQQGSEVVTVVRELEECTDCGTRRVVSENTEVTAVVDADEVGLDDDASTGGDSPGSGSSGLGGAVERSGALDEADDETSPVGDAGSVDEASAVGDASPADEGTETGDVTGGALDSSRPAVEEFDDIDPADPATDDAEILTDDDDEPERQPGEWPEDPDVEPEDAAGAPSDPGDGSTGDGEEGADATPELDTDAPDDESLSGITVPEGRIVCRGCGFEVEAQSGYREGDPCPDCGAWLVTESDE